MNIANQNVRMSEIEFKWALQQAVGAGLVEIKGDDDVRLSDTGIDLCFTFEQTLSPVDRLLLTIYYQHILTLVRNEQSL